MSLDQNLFTLHLTQNADNPNVVDLVDPSGTVHYRKQRLPGTEYKAEVYDPISQSLLITATAPGATSKFKTLELYNPTTIVELKYTGTISFRWGFRWEQHEFEWKREECFMVRKPDPPVLVAVTKEPAGRLKTTSVQILDYNLNRFDIDDRKGLEIVILTALLTFQDANETYHAPQDASQSPTLGRKASATPDASTTRAPQPPPKPAPKTGVERIAELQATQGEYNEVMVGDEGHVDHYAEYCTRLLEDDAMLFVTVKSAAAEQVPKVLQVVEQAKRIRHKAGLSDETELHQYVVYETGEKQKGPRRINLDDNIKPSNMYSPPTSLAVHLSKIDMPELQPKPTIHDKPSKDVPSKDKGSKDVEGKDKASKNSKKKEDKKGTEPKTPPEGSRPGGRLSKNPRPSSPISAVHAHQPSPSHSQLNNFATYPAPPAVNTSSRPPSSRPSSSQSPSVSFPTPTVPNLGTLNTGRDRPARHSFHAPTGAQSFYGPGAYAPPSNTSPNSGPYPPYAPSYAPQPSWQPPHGGALPPPPPLHPPAPTGPPYTQKPSSIVTGLIDSFRRR
ncbi:hypothetical protein LshimejAT787_1003660 [Lyophyllum shimeji]|uniref:Uncharacterized protein n=1 Tax=Lyophyllum shimeji TaxID=47721 RepID=A0A9P3PU69_LYOSH|nr:hypothetical protein LshimejAT787_1003660 [Lyophyllum shimeji]